MEKEIKKNILENFGEELAAGMKYGKQGNYNSAISHFRNAISFASHAMQQDNETAKRLRIDGLKMIAEGLMLKAYVERGAKTWTEEEAEEIRETAQGDLIEENPHMEEIMRELFEWEQAGSFGNYLAQGRGTK